MMRKRIGLLQLNLALAILLTCANSYANLTPVTPNPTFGNATDVKVGSMVTSSGARVDLVAARNAKGHMFTGATWVTAEGKQAWIASHSVDSRIRNQAGATSAGTVKATIEHKVSKPKVMAAILDKARKGGKTFGRFLVGNSPYGRAFALAVLALEGSRYFWSDDAGDFVREKDDETYVVFESGKNASGLSIQGHANKTSLKEACAKAQTECQILGYAKGSEAANKAAEDYCKSQTFKLGEETYNYETVGWSGFCYSTEKNVLSESKSVKIAKWYDYKPITLDEFIDEATPEADAEPSDWVNTSQVKPDEEDVTVKGGTVAQTNPYTDPKDGKVKQTKWEFEDKDGDGDADTVRETTLERPDLPPNSPEAPELKPPTEDTGTGGTGDGDKDEPKPDSASQPPFDLCKEHPEILACQKMGEPEAGEFNDIKIPHVTDDTTWEEDRFLPSNGTCPQPKTFHVFGKPVQLSYEPLCRFMAQVRFIILAAFILMSAYLTFGSLRRD